MTKVNVTTAKSDRGMEPQRWSNSACMKKFKAIVKISIGNLLVLLVKGIKRSLT